MLSKVTYMNPPAFMNGDLKKRGWLTAYEPILINKVKETLDQLVLPSSLKRIAQRVFPKFLDNPSVYEEMDQQNFYFLW
jgi:hypothetical protein